MAAKTKAPPKIELSEELQAIWDAGVSRVRDNCALNRKIFNELLKEEEGDYYYMPKLPDKPILGKSGAQKYVLFYGDEFVGGVEHEMFNNTPFFRGKGVLQDKAGTFISDGVSAQFPKSGNKDFAFNAAAKMCLKRAFVDSVVSGYKLSFLFYGDEGNADDKEGVEDQEAEGAKKSVQKKKPASRQTAAERKAAWENHMENLDPDEAKVLRDIAGQIKAAKSEEDLEEVVATINEFVDKGDEYVLQTLQSAYASRKRYISQKKGE